MKATQLYAVHTKVIGIGNNPIEAILDAIHAEGFQLDDNDVLAITSKVVAYEEDRLVKLSDVKPSHEAETLAQRYSLLPEFAELVVREADRIYGGVERAVLTLKDSVLTANAGIDNKNAPDGYVVLWPREAKEWAKKAREKIKQKTGKQVAILVVDSGLKPLRKGTSGLALAVAGFRPVRDRRGEKDIYGKPLVITQHAVADDLASAAHLLMGEAAETTPAVLLKSAPVDFDNGAYGPADMELSPKECIFMSSFRADSER